MALPDSLNKPREGMSVEGYKAEVLARHTEDKVVLKFYSPEAEKGGSFYMESDQAWRLASDIIASALKIDPTFVKYLMDDLELRMAMLGHRV